MAVIGLLKYEDFLTALDPDGQTRPIRLQAYSAILDTRLKPLRHYLFLVELATETLDDDIIVCRFLTGEIVTSPDIDPAKLQRLNRLNQRAADLLRQDLVRCGFTIDPGLIQLNQTVSIITAWPDCWNELNPQEVQT